MRHLRGISPVVATALLVLIAIATAALLYLWVSGTVSNQPSEPALQEKFRIESVTINVTGNKYSITAYVRNVGGSTINITTAYLMDGAGNVLYLNDSVKTTVPAGQTKKLRNVFNNVELNPGQAYTIKLVTLYGTEATYTFIAPTG